MAILKDEKLSLEIRATGISSYDDGNCYANYEFLLSWDGQPVLNKEILKNWYSAENGCGFRTEELDGFGLLRTMVQSLKTCEVKIWETFPDPDASVSIYPNRRFPYLADEDSGCWTVIVSPDGYIFEGADCYVGKTGVSFIMTPTAEDFKKFVADFYAECAVLPLPEKYRWQKGKTLIAEDI